MSTELIPYVMALSPDSPTALNSLKSYLRASQHFSEAHHLHTPHRQAILITMHMSPPHTVPSPLLPRVELGIAECLEQRGVVRRATLLRQQPVQLSHRADIPLSGLVRLWVQPRRVHQDHPQQQRRHRGVQQVGRVGEELP
jgi:hypothetical protein